MFDQYTVLYYTVGIFQKPQYYERDGKITEHFRLACSVVSQEGHNSTDL